MLQCAVKEAPAWVAVGMGQAALAQKPASLTAILGSCVGVSLFSPRRQLGVLGHVVLPHGNGNSSDSAPAKYADRAVPYMLELLRAYDVMPSGLVAKIAGGACMFGKGAALQIGETNIDAVVRALEAAGLHVAGRDVGGTVGRRVSLDCSTGCLTIQTVGNPPRTI